MITADQRKSDANSQQGLQDDVRLVSGINSWQLWTSVLVLLLLTGTLVSLSFPALLNPARGLIVLMCLVSGATLHRQLNRLKVLREGLIEQMDSARKHRVEAEKFYGLSIVDPLTGLYNRRFGETRLREEVERAEQSGEPLVLLAIDFDRFKEINDKYGHAAGDLALKEFSRRLQRAIRACDVPIRLGGDEFLVILPECCVAKIPTIMSRMGSIAFDLYGKKIPVCFSYGMAQYEVNDTPEAITRRADERLYSAKAKRKDDTRPQHTPTSNVSGNLTKETQKDQRSIVPGSASAQPTQSQAGGDTLTLDFRRSERVHFEMPTGIHVYGRGNGSPAFEEGKTLSVNAHGALIVLSTPVEIGQPLRLVNPRTREEVECRVCRFAMRDRNGASHVGVEFLAVAPTFWDVPSRPSDWGSDPAAPCDPWNDRPTVASTARPAGLVGSWVLPAGSKGARVSMSAAALIPVPSGAAKGSLNEMQTIIDEAMHSLESSAENRAMETKRKGLGTHKWLGIASVLFVPLLILLLWIAIPHKSTAPPSATSANEGTSPEKSNAMMPMFNPTPNQTASGAASIAPVAEATMQPGLPTELAHGVPDMAGFRLAETKDFDPAGVSWLQSSGQEASAQILGAYTGSGESHAYLLVGKDKSWRVLVLADGQVVSDVRYKSLAAAALVPRESVQKIHWDGLAPTKYDGDGLLIVRSAEDPASGVVLFLNGKEVAGGHPADYREVPVGVVR